MDPNVPIHQLFNQGGNQPPPIFQTQSFSDGSRSLLMANPNQPQQQSHLSGANGGDPRQEHVTYYNYLQDEVCSPPQQPPLVAPPPPQISGAGGVVYHHPANFEMQLPTDNIPQTGNPNLLLDDFFFDLSELSDSTAQPQAPPRIYDLHQFLDELNTNLPPETPPRELERIRQFPVTEQGQLHQDILPIMTPLVQPVPPVTRSAPAAAVGTHRSVIMHTTDVQTPSEKRQRQPRPKSPRQVSPTSANVPATRSRSRSGSMPQVESAGLAPGRTDDGPRTTSSMIDPRYEAQMMSALMTHPQQQQVAQARHLIPPTTSQPQHYFVGHNPTLLPANFPQAPHQFPEAQMQQFHEQQMQYATPMATGLVGQHQQSFPPPVSGQCNPGIVPVRRRSKGPTISINPEQSSYAGAQSSQQNIDLEFLSSLAVKQQSELQPKPKRKYARRKTSTGQTPADLPVTSAMSGGTFQQLEQPKPTATRKRAPARPRTKSASIEPEPPTVAVMPVPTSVVPNPSHTVLSPLQSQAELVGAPIAYHQGRPQHRATDVMTFHVASPSPQRLCGGTDANSVALEQQFQQTLVLGQVDSSGPASGNLPVPNMDSFAQSRASQLYISDTSDMTPAPSHVLAASTNICGPGFSGTPSCSAAGPAERETSVARVATDEQTDKRTPAESESVGNSPPAPSSDSQSKPTQENPPALSVDVKSGYASVQFKKVVLNIPRVKKRTTRVRSDKSKEKPKEQPEISEGAQSPALSKSVSEPEIPDPNNSVVSAAPKSLAEPMEVQPAAAEIESTLTGPPEEAPKVTASASVGESQDGNQAAAEDAFSVRKLQVALDSPEKEVDDMPLSKRLQKSQSLGSPSRGRKRLPRKVKESPALYNEEDMYQDEADEERVVRATRSRSVKQLYKNQPASPDINPPPDKSVMSEPSDAHEGDSDVSPVESATRKVGRSKAPPKENTSRRRSYQRRRILSETSEESDGSSEVSGHSQVSKMEISGKTLPRKAATPKTSGLAKEGNVEEEPLASDQIGVDHHKNGVEQEKSKEAQPSSTATAPPKKGRPPMKSGLKMSTRVVVKNPGRVGRGRPSTRTSSTDENMSGSATSGEHKIVARRTAEPVRERQLWKKVTKAGQTQNATSGPKQRRKPVEPENFTIKFSQHFRPPYTAEEKERLYADKCFVMDLMDIGKERDNMFIWQIEEPQRRLRQYYPSKYAGRLYFTSSPVTWMFFESDFRSEEFYDRFQPIVVVVVKTEEHFQEMPEKYRDSVTYAQFVYIDKSFFTRMTKVLGRIHFLENIRPIFMNALVVPVILSLEPDFIVKYSQAVLDGVGKLGRFKEYLRAWNIITSIIDRMLDRVRGFGVLNPNAWLYLITFPHFRCSARGIKKNFPCSACASNGKTPSFKITTTTKTPGLKPYYHQSLKTLAAEFLTDAPEPLYWCRTCTEVARKVHRLIHFRHFLVQLKRQNMAQDAKVLMELSGTVTDSILMWIHNIDNCWKNAMFLDFQVRVAEVDAAFNSIQPTQPAGASTAVSNQEPVSQQQEPEPPSAPVATCDNIDVP